MNITKIKEAPQSPGCYMFKDSRDHVIYVGKAKSLVRRVKQYFYKDPKELFGTDPDNKLLRLVLATKDVEYIETRSELDALMLEYRLIKQHRPMFNSQLVRDRHYLYIAGGKGVYPGLYVTRQEENVLLGGFTDERGADAALRLISALWKTPACGKHSFEGSGQVCLNYHMSRCLGPCAGKCEISQYSAVMSEIKRFLRGTDTAAVRRLRAEMRAASKALMFERANEIKQLLDSAESLRRNNNRSWRPGTGRFAVWIRPYRSGEFSLFRIEGELAVSRADYRGSVVISDAAIPREDRRAVAACLAEIHADKVIIRLAEGQEYNSAVLPFPDISPVLIPSTL